MTNYLIIQLLLQNCDQTVEFFIWTRYLYSGIWCQTISQLLEMKRTLLFLFLVFFSCDGKLSGKVKLFTHTIYISTIYFILDKEYAQMPELFHMDNYDRCMLRGDESFFCSFDYQLEPLDFNNVSDTWKIIQVKFIC